MSARVSGWILPDGLWFECKPWEHLRFIKQLAWLEERRHTHPDLNRLWFDPDEEKLRSCLAKLGLVKVCYHLVDADTLNTRQLKTLQSLYDLFPPEAEIDFVGGIRLKLQVRLFLKLRDPERLNALGS